MERSVEMLVGLLGILKAGGAYLPLDPGYPIDRLEMMLADSGARVLLTQEGLLEVMPAGDLKTICLDRDWEEISRESRHNLQIVTSPDHLAYVIYTSGSTGKPKGVMISHRSICNRLEWMNERYPLMEDDSVLQKTSFSFDASVWEFYVPLIAGARVVMARPGGHQDAGYLVKTIAERQITTLQVVPSMLEVIVEERGLAKCKELRRVFCGGEALKTKLKERFFEKIKAELINLYGPTESSIDATSWRCERKGVGNEVERENVPIGKPIANIQMYVLNRSLQAVPVGVAGELHIGGVGLARGYLDRAELTAERFAPNPWGELPGGRMYRTGDIGRYLPDGNIEYLRRADDQVKVRGYRIELGEVEAALKEHALVRNAVVVVREGQNGQKKLTAYIVPGKDHIQSIAWVQNILNDRLPTYMIPSEFVVLEKLPLTKNGKIDRAALPAPDRSRLGSDSDYVAPSTPIEDMLAGIWASVLGLERVGVHDDFFGLGGHSLLVTQVNSRVREIFQVELPLRLHFDCPTIASLAGKIEVAIKKGDDLQVSPIKRVARTGPLPTSFAQERLWFFDQLAPDSVAYNIAVAIRLTGSLNASVLEGSICEIVRRHEALRTIFQDIDGQPYQVITPFESFVLPVVDLSEAPLTRRESEMSRLATENSQRPFSLSEGPLFRVVLLQLCAEEHIALFNMHHIISDGWSVGVFIREIMTIYSALSKCELVQMSELPIQYADFAAWQREYMRGNILESQLEYWRQQLQGDLPVLELPTDRLRPAIQTFRGHTASFSLPPDIVTPLKELSRCENTTLFMTLLAGFNILLSLYSGQEDIIVGTNVANRNRSELEGLIGFFINNLALRTDLSENPTFKEVLRRVRKICVGAYAHQDLPFEKLAQEFQPGRALSLNPLFQTLFVLQNTPQESLELPGLKLAPVAIESRTSPFDLALNMSESGNFLSGFIQYNTDLFKKPTIDRMIKQYEAVLREAVQNPDQRLKSFSLLLEEENLQLLYAFSN